MRLADCVVPHEYGTTPSEMSEIGAALSRPLMTQIRENVMACMDNQDELPRSFFYFTSESHVQSLINCLFFSGHKGLPTRTGKFTELSYLSQLSFFVYRKIDGALANDEFIVVFRASMGMVRDIEAFKALDNSHAPPVLPSRAIYTFRGSDFVELTNQYTRTSVDGVRGSIDD